MYFTTTNNDYQIDEPKHKPAISFVSENCYKCSDGGVEQFGRTPKEAYEALAELRN